MSLASILTYSPEVADARAAGLPIVALESTIITHGMPFPQNVETAKLVEAEIRAHGAVPATIAIMDGRILIGMADAQLDALGQAQRVAKLSRADLAACVATGGMGATTGCPSDPSLPRRATMAYSTNKMEFLVAMPMSMMSPMSD